MVSMRFTTTTMLLGFFLFILVHANHVNGLLMQGRSIDQKVGEEKYNYMEVSETRSKVVGGRKMGLEYYVEEKESLMKTGANSKVGNCGNGMKGMLNIECELSLRRLPSNVKRDRQKKESTKHYLDRTVKNTLEKPFGSLNSKTNEKDASRTTVNTRSILTKQDGESSLQPEKPIKTKFFNPYHISKSSSTGKQDPLEAATQDIFNMMNKDYHPKGRRKPPVNNHLPIYKP